MTGRGCYWHKVCGERARKHPAIWGQFCPMKNYPIQNTNSACFGVYMKKRLFSLLVWHSPSGSCFLLLLWAASAPLLWRGNSTMDHLSRGQWWQFYRWCSRSCMSFGVESIEIKSPTLCYSLVACPWESYLNTLSFRFLLQRINLMTSLPWVCFALSQSITLILEMFCLSE